MSTTHQSMFEGLFERRLVPTGAFAAELAAAGYTPGVDTLKYPTEVWLQCLEIARRHRWPELDRDAAYRHLGLEFARGFLETSTGRLLAEAMPFMSLESFLGHLDSYFRLGREDAQLTFDIVERSANFARVTVHNPAAVPGTFVGSIVEVAFERVGQKGSVEVRHSSPTDYELVVRW